MPSNASARATTREPTSNYKRILEEAGRHKRVTSKVFQKNESLVGGIDEAHRGCASVLTGARSEASGRTEWDRPHVQRAATRATKSPRTRPSGQSIFWATNPCGPPLRPCTSVPGAPIASDAQRARGGGGSTRQEDLFFPASQTTWLGRTATAGGARGGRSDRRLERSPGLVGAGGREGRTVPHGHDRRSRPSLFTLSSFSLDGGHRGGGQGVAGPLGRRDERDGARRLRETTRCGRRSRWPSPGRPPVGVRPSGGTRARAWWTAPGGRTWADSGHRRNIQPMRRVRKALDAAGQSASRS